VSQAYLTKWNLQRCFKLKIGFEIVFLRVNYYGKYQKIIQEILPTIMSSSIKVVMLNCNLEHILIPNRKLISAFTSAAHQIPIDADFILSGLTYVTHKQFWRIFCSQRHKKKICFNLFRFDKIKALPRIPWLDHWNLRKLYFNWWKFGDNQDEHTQWLLNILTTLSQSEAIKANLLEIRVPDSKINYESMNTYLRSRTLLCNIKFICEY